MAELSKAFTSVVISLVRIRFFLTLVKNRANVGVGFGPRHLRNAGVAFRPGLFISIGLGRKAEPGHIFSSFRLFQVNKTNRKVNGNFLQYFWPAVNIYSSNEWFVPWNYLAADTMYRICSNGLY